MIVLKTTASGVRLDKGMYIHFSNEPKELVWRLEAYTADGWALLRRARPSQGHDRPILRRLTGVEAYNDCAPFNDEVWTARDGRRFDVDKMVEPHVRASLRLILRMIRKGSLRRVSPAEVALARQLTALTEPDQP